MNGLILVTQTKESTNAIQIEIDWDKYSIDKDITTITFPIRNIPKRKSRRNNDKNTWS